MGLDQGKDFGQMNAIEVARRIIMRWERCGRRMPDGRLESYPDPVSKGDPWTIGWGSTGKGIKKGTVWTEKQADEDLESRIAHLDLVVMGMVKVDAEEYELGALISICDNVGYPKIEASTLIRLMNEGADREEVADQFLRWDKSTVNGNLIQVEGLLNRRKYERSVFIGEVDP